MLSFRSRSLKATPTEGIGSVTKSETRVNSRDLGLALLAFLVAFVLWQVPALFFLTYPLRLFVTLIHELGHGVAALATGGEFLSFHVTTSGGGLAYTRGGWRFLVIQSGYLGTALFGAALLWLTYRTARPQHVAIGLGVALIVASLFYARLGGGGLGSPEERQLFWATAGNLLTLTVGVLSGAALIALGRRGRREVVIVTLTFLAFVVGLQAITDAWTVFKIALIPHFAAPLNDASTMAREYGGAAALWALLWMAADAAIFGAAVYYVLLRDRLRWP